MITRRLSSPPLSSLYHIGSLRIACGLPLVARAPLCCSSRLWPKSDQSRHRCLRLIINSVCVSLSRSVPHCSAHNYATRRARLLSSEQASAQIGSHRRLVWYKTDRSSAQVVSVHLSAHLCAISREPCACARAREARSRRGHAGVRRARARSPGARQRVRARRLRHNGERATNND